MDADKMVIVREWEEDGRQWVIAGEAKDNGMDLALLERGQRGLYAFRFVDFDCAPTEREARYDEAVSDMLRGPAELKRVREEQVAAAAARAEKRAFVELFLANKAAQRATEKGGE